MHFLVGEAVELRERSRVRGRAPSRLYRRSQDGVNRPATARNHAGGRERQPAVMPHGRGSRGDQPSRYQTSGAVGRSGKCWPRLSLSYRQASPPDEGAHAPDGRLATTEWRHYPAAVTVQGSPVPGTRFPFGANWQDFLSLIDENRILGAERSLQSALGLTRLEGLSFLDMGSGSGLFSLAALRLGAARVHSFDIDPASVACTAFLRQRPSCMKP